MQSDYYVSVKIAPNDAQDADFVRDLDRRMRDALSRSAVTFADYHWEYQRNLETMTERYLICATGQRLDVRRPEPSLT